MPNLELENPLDHNAKPIKIGDNITPLEVSTDKLWYQKTPTDTYEVVNKKYVDDNAGGGSVGTFRWHQAFGGYKSGNSSTTNYYMPYYPWNQAWNNYDTSPTTISYPDAYSAIWIAPAAGTLTRIDVIIRGTSTDDVQFYVFKGDIAVEGEASTSLTQIGASGVIDITASAETHYATASISSSNTFAAGDALWVMYKKEEHNFSTTDYFSGSISGEYS